MHTIKSIKEVNDNTIKKYELIYHASLPYLKTNLKNMDIILEILKEKYSIEEFNDKNFLLNIEKETNEKYGKVGNSNILGFKIRMIVQRNCFQKTKIIWKIFTLA